jgi:hypothetical protein
MQLCAGAEQTLLNPFYEATDQSMVEDLVSIKRQGQA